MKDEVTLAFSKVFKHKLDTKLLKMYKFIMKKTKLLIPLYIKQNPENILLLVLQVR